MGFFSGTEETPKADGSKPLTGEQAGKVAAAGEFVKSKNLGGRPRKDGLPNKSGVQANGVGGGMAKPVAGNPQQTETPVSEADIEFARTVAEAGLKILAKVETNIITGIIESIGDTYISERKDAYLRQCEIGEPDVELVKNAVGALATKYSILSRYAPEAALLGWAAMHGMAFQGVTNDLKRLAIQVKGLKAEAAKDASTP